MDKQVESVAAAIWLEGYGKHRPGKNKWPDDVIGGSQDLFRRMASAAISALSAAPQKTIALTCQCANSKTDPCIVCGKPKTLVTAEWVQKMAAREGDLDPTTGPPALPAAPQPVAVPDGWDERILTEMERRFNLRGEDDDRMRIDDTQIGVEFAIEQVRTLLTTPPISTHRMGDALLREFFENGRSIRRKSWPAGDYIDADGAEGGTIWYYRNEDDELTPGYRLSFHDIGSGDWEVLSPPNQSPPD